jgi:hypothetical protein
MTKSRSCDHCSRPFTVMAVAPHKRFCSTSCRNSWHSERAKRALQSLAEAEASAKAEPEAWPKPLAEVP